MCGDFSVNYFQATGTGMLVNSALTSKEAMVSSELMFFPLRLSANPLLSLTEEKFLPVYFCKILVKNFESLYLVLIMMQQCTRCYKDGKRST